MNNKLTSFRTKKKTKKTLRHPRFTLKEESNVLFFVMLIYLYVGTDLYPLKQNLLGLENSN